MKRILLFTALFFLTTVVGFAQVTSAENPNFRRFIGQSSTPANPATGQFRLFVGTDGNLKLVDSAGTVSSFGGGGATSITGTLTSGGVVLATGTSTVSTDTGITYTTSPAALIVNSQAAGLRGVEAYQYSTTVDAGLFLGRKARGTLASPLDVAVSDALASFQADGYASTAFRSGGAIQSIVTAISGTNITTKWRFLTSVNSSNTSVIDILSTGELNWVTDNSADIGESGALRPRTGYFGTSVVAPTVTAATLVSTAALTASGLTTLSAGQVIATRVVTAAGAVTVAATDYVVVVNKASGEATTVNLPAGVTGTVFIVKDGKGDAATNVITITPAAGNIDGASTYVISVNYGSANLVYSGTQWLVF